jgi:hypothetical protein
MSLLALLNPASRAHPSRLPAFPSQGFAVENDCNATGPKGAKLIDLIAKGF